MGAAARCAEVWALGERARARRRIINAARSVKGIARLPPPRAYVLLIARANSSDPLYTEARARAEKITAARRASHYMPPFLPAALSLFALPLPIKTQALFTISNQARAQRRQ